MKEGVYYLGELGNPPILSGYLIVNEKGDSAIVESGPTSTADEYLKRASEYVPLDTLKYVFISHVHLDHSGGFWKISRELPQVKAVVFEKGARHLIDPRKLVEASRMALGRIYDFWGDPEPVQEDKIVSVADGYLNEEFGVRIIYTPGHASHSTALYHEKTQTLFPGDSAGMLIIGEGGVLWPAAPPPFYMDMFVESLKKLQQLKLKRICYPHYGCSGRPYAVLEEALSTYTFLDGFLREGCRRSSGADLFDEIMGMQRFRGLPRSEYFDEFYRLNLRGFAGSCV
ncbi:MAG: MBL fold metallo-hydrolase [Nitrososphaeria archaeon]